MKLQDIQRRIGCSLNMAIVVQELVKGELAVNQTSRILCRSALAELNDALACGNVAHPKIDAAARYLRDALDLMGDSEIGTVPPFPEHARPRLQAAVANLKTSAALRAQDFQGGDK